MNKQLEKDLATAARLAAEVKRALAAAHPDLSAAQKIVQEAVKAASKVAVALPSLPDVSIRVSYASLLAHYAPRPIRSEREYMRMLKIVERYTRPDLTKDEAAFLDLVAGLVEAYESEHFPIEDTTTSGTMLEHLLDSRGISQAEFARKMDVSRQLITDIIKGRASLTPERIRQFADFFKVSPEVFLPDSA